MTSQIRNIIENKLFSVNQKLEQTTEKIVSSLSVIGDTLSGTVGVHSNGEDLATQTTLEAIDTKIDLINTTLGSGILQIQSNGLDLATNEQISDMYEMMIGNNLNDKLQVQSNGESLATESTLAIMSAKLDGEISVTSNGGYVASEATVSAIDAKLAGVLSVQSNGSDIATETTVLAIDTKLGGTLSVQSNSENIATETTVLAIDTKLGGTLSVQSNSANIATEATLSALNNKVSVPMSVVYKASPNASASYLVTSACKLHSVYISLGEGSSHSTVFFYDATSGVTSATDPYFGLSIKGVNQQNIVFPGPITFTTGVGIRAVVGELNSGGTGMNSASSLTIFYTT